MAKKDNKGSNKRYTSSPVEPIHLDTIKDRPTTTGFDMEAPLRKFDTLDSFENFLKDETWDNEFDHMHAKVNYYPPFVLHECHDNLEKIKPTMCNLNKKFVRHLHHHIDRHLLKEITKFSGIDYEFGKGVKELKGTDLIWHFVDESNHGFNEEDLHGRKWKLELDVSCHIHDPEIVVDMRTVAI